MEVKKLLMSFKTHDDRKVSLTVDNPREDITEAEIKTVMDLIVSKNVFSSNKADLVKALDAKIFVTDTTEFDLVVD